MIKKEKYLGVGVTNATEKEVSEYIFARLHKRGKRFFVVTPNPELIMLAQHDPKYKSILNEADLSLPDGVGLFFASLLLGHPLKERIPGIDFVEELCRRSKNNPMSIGLLGAGKGVAQQASDRLQEKYPWIKVVYACEEWDEKVLMIKDFGLKHKEIGGKRIVNRKSYLLNQPMDILFVAFGSPKQEKWIHAHFSELPAQMVMGVGGAFDFISGNIVRAPYLIRAIGMEWLFRLMVQPWRIKRQLALLRFIWLVLIVRLGLKKVN